MSGGKNLEGHLPNKSIPWGGREEMKRGSK